MHAIRNVHHTLWWNALTDLLLIEQKVNYFKCFKVECNDDPKIKYIIKDTDVIRKGINDMNRLYFHIIIPPVLECVELILDHLHFVLSSVKMIYQFACLFVLSGFFARITTTLLLCLFKIFDR